MSKSDELSDLMGQLGSFAWFTAAVHIMSFVFVFPVLDHRCFVAEFDGYDYDNDSLGLDLNSPGELDAYIPKTLEGALDSCHKYEESGKNTTITCDKGYVYNSSYFISSRITDFDLVCENEWMRAFLQSIFLCGTLVGALITGQVADKYGRKPIFCISGLLQWLFGIAGIYIESYIPFAASMFVYGLFGGAGAAVPAVVLSMEIVGASYRNLCGTMFTVLFGTGAITVAAWAYFLPLEAHQLQLIYAMHSIVLFGHFWIMDESICWLWANNRKEEAVNIAKKAVKMNGGTFQNHYDIKSKPELPAPEGNAVESGKVEAHTNISTLDLFKFPKLRQRTLVMLYCWFATSLSYFGFSFNSVQLLGNPFLMFIINIFVEVPGHLIAIFIVPKIGNKPMFSLALLLTGTAGLVDGLLTKGMVVNIIAMAGKIPATVAFDVINNYTAELFPTCLRNTALGICIMSARIAAAMIPEIDLLAAASEQIPTLIFGTAGVIGGILSFSFLPETLNKPIPQTIEDVENSSKEKANGDIMGLSVVSA